MKIAIRVLVITLSLLAIVSAEHLAAQAQAQAQDQASKTTKPITTARPAIAKPRPAQSSQNQLATPPTGPLDYECAGGNCSCAGAKDCVDMKKICAPGTLGCNDYGCTCAEGEDPEGGDG